MPRDPSGSYSLPALGNPAVSGTPITIAWWNGTSTDMASAITDSLSRSGLGGMLVPFTLVDGTVTTPAFAFQNESNTGIYRFGAFDARFSVGGTDVFKWVSAGATSILAFTALAGITSTGAASSAGITSTGGTGNGDGVDGTATGTGAGVKGTSTSTSGSVGVVGHGVSSQLGLLVNSSAANVDVARVDGYIDVSQATNPASTTGFTNRITPKNVAKAWALITTNGSGGITVVDGFNITSAGLAAFTVTVNFAGSMGSANYVVVGEGVSGGVPRALLVNSTSTGNCTLKLYDTSTNSAIQLSTTAATLHLAVYGAQ